MRHQAFAILSLHAKMHRQLDAIEQQRSDLVRRIEEQEIRAYDNEAAFQRLEAMKREVLAIRFA